MDEKGIVKKKITMIDTRNIMDSRTETRTLIESR